MAVEKGDIKYPEPERFWRQSPKLIELQGDLGTVWNDLEATPSFPEEELLSKGAGDLIAIHTKNPQYESYEIFELDSTPSINSHYPKKPYQIMPRVSDQPGEVQIKIYLQKWPSGYRINGAPVTRGYDRVKFVHQGEATFKQVPDQLRSEATRLVALNLTDGIERKRQDLAGLTRVERIVNIINEALEKSAD